MLAQCQSFQFRMMNLLLLDETLELESAVTPFYSPPPKEKEEEKGEGISLNI